MMETIATDSVVTREDEIILTTFGNSGVVLTLRDNIPHILNAVSMRIWKMLDGKRTVDEIVSIICRDFDVNREHVEKDVLCVLKEFSNRGLLRIV